jgi:hypothetical protein
MSTLQISSDSLVGRHRLRHRLPVGRGDCKEDAEGEEQGAGQHGGEGGGVVVVAGPVPGPWKTLVMVLWSDRN